MLPLFILAHFAHHLITALPVPLLPFIRDEFALDYTQSGLIISAFSLSYGLSQLPAGWLADRIEPRILITLGISGAALFGLLVGLSQTYIMMIVFLVLMGLVGGGYHPSAPPLITASVDEKNQGRALGFHLTGGSASYFLVPLIGAAMAATWGWRSSFIGLAIPAIILGAIFYVLLGRRSDTKHARHRITDSHEKTTYPQNHWRRLVPFIILSTSTMAVMFSTTSFITLYLVDHFGADRVTAAAFMALIYSCGLWASPLGGYLSDRLGRIPMILGISFAAGPVIYLLNLAPYGLGMGALLIVIGMIMYTRMPVSEAYIISHTSKRKRSTILGIYYAGSRGGPGIIMPVIGYLADRYGFHTSFTIMGAIMVAVTLISSIFLWRSRD